MSEFSMKGTINASADKVWKTISDFNGIPKYCSAFSNSTMEGSGVGAVRTLTTQDGAQIVERLESLDEKARSLRYAIVTSPLPLEGYVSTMKLKDLGEGQCELDWSCTFQPKGASEDELKKLIEGVYSIACEGLKKLHGG